MRVTSRASLTASAGWRCPRLSGCTAWRRLRPSRRPGRDLSDLPARQRRSRAHHRVRAGCRNARSRASSGRTTSRIPRSASRSTPTVPFSFSARSKPGQYPLRQRESAVAIAEGYTERAKQRMVRLTRKFGGMMSTSWCRPIILSSRATLFTSSNASSKAH